MRTKKELLRALTLKIAPALMAFIIKTIYFTCKKRYKTSNTLPDEPVLIAFWHGELIFQPYVYNTLREKPKGVVLISDHFDGKVIAKATKYLGLGTILGSSNRSASRVLIQAIRHLKEGYDVGITPDGPRGPRHEVADGIIIMAQKTNSKIVLFSTKASSYWQLNSWDKFVIPKPFSTLTFSVSQSFDVSDMQLEEAKHFIRDEMIKNGA